MTNNLLTISVKYDMYLYIRYILYYISILYIYYISLYNIKNFPKGEEPNCSDQLEKLNTIYTISNLSYALATVIAGLIADKYGLIAVRLFGFFIELSGFILVTLNRFLIFFS